MPNEILIEVAYALPKKQLIIPVKVKQGITAREAIQLSGIIKKFPEIDLNVWKLINEEHHPIYERHKYAFSYLAYVKREV